LGLIAFISLLQESQFAFFGWRRFRKNRSEGRRSASQSNAPKSRAVFLGIAAGAGLVAFGQLISWVTHAKSPAGITDLLSGLRAGPWTAAGMLVLIAAVAPVCEEILFRGAIFGLAHARPNLDGCDNGFRPLRDRSS
jgi:membrane protease YdiL (CAAX protease family)